MASADYLRRYLDGGKKKKKKEKEKKKKTKHAGMRVVEMDDDWGFEHKGGEVSDDDEAPVVVLDESTKGMVVQRKKGTWSAVDARNASPQLHDGDDDDLSVPRKPRHDSDDDDLSVPRKRRHESEDDDISAPRKPRVDSDDDLSVPRRGRLDSDDEDDDLSVPRQPLVDDDGDLAVRRKPENPPQKRRHDSDDDLSPPRRSKMDDDDASPSRQRREEQKGPSGHAAGLIRSADFRDAEAKLRAERTAALERDAGEAPAETVYRDRRGRKLDMLNEFMRIEAEREGKKREEREQYEWGRGTKQKKDEALARQELEEIKNEPFARAVDDPKLEQMRRDAIRDGDPMASYIREKRGEAAATTEKDADKTGDHRRTTTRTYKGPNPTPNRFGILPGYRWDGIDRGNGWEAKLQAKKANAIARKHDRYAWSSADM
ncbi:hypothetical protein CTAYLR_006670 [Chrysophaeum taylorii]|uniref:BUD13 homolog n=1 Tax=Chrysophaeum taylorii TaxID=2483200 RepID=A0AAD7XIN7_9STRA|nr:hypothetical protein CTAYLR_006670 [Chrysophaeum taylorii]